MNRTTVGIQTLGCKLNQAESQTLARLLADSGYQVIAYEDSPDIYILNSCTVTGIADRKCRNALRRARAGRPQSLIVATGCYAKRVGAEATSVAPGVIAHCGDQRALLDMLLSRRPPAGIAHDSGANAQRTRSFVKIQDGCNSRCAYCIVPSVRGHAKSLATGAILSEVRRRVAEGYREVVLTGTNIGSYDSDGVMLGELVARVLGETGVPRLRLSSLQPHDITEPLLARFHDRRLCRHLHMSLQSGSEDVLLRMGRRYTVEEYRRAVAVLISRIPDLAVTSDMIVGFPGETEEEHSESIALCRELGFASIHVFPYSSRPGTPSENVAPVDSKIRRLRTGAFLGLARECQREFQSRFIGRIMDVLWEAKVDGAEGTWSGLTDNYIRVRARSTEPIANATLPMKLEQSCGSYVRGSIVGASTFSP